MRYDTKIKSKTFPKTFIFFDENIFRKILKNRKFQKVMFSKKWKKIRKFWLFRKKLTFWNFHFFEIFQKKSKCWWKNRNFSKNEIFQNFDEVEKRQLCLDFYNLKTSGDESINKDSEEIKSIPFSLRKSAIKAPSFLFLISLRMN